MQLIAKIFPKFFQEKALNPSEVNEFRQFSGSTMVLVNSETGEKVERKILYVQPLAPNVAESIIKNHPEVPWVKGETVFMIRLAGMGSQPSGTIIQKEEKITTEV